MEESAGLLCQRDLSGLLTKNYPPSIEGFSRNPSAFAHSELVQLSFVKRSGRPYKCGSRHRMHLPMSKKEKCPTYPIRGLIIYEEPTSEVR